MESAAGPMLYQKLQLLEPDLESEEEEEETAELLVLHPGEPQESSAKQGGGLPGAWARLVAALLLLAVGISLALSKLHTRGGSAGGLDSAAPWPSGHSHHPSVFHHGAVISPAAVCSRLGRELLVAGGNVVDAGVGAALCLAVVHPHATGLGARFWGLFHNGSSGNATALTPGLAQTLVPGVGLPAALPALQLLHAHFGCLPWPQLLEGPTTLAQQGFLVDASLARALAAQDTKGLCPLLCHADGTPLGVGTWATNPRLAAVLRNTTLTRTPDPSSNALLGLVASDLGLEVPSAGPMPTLEPALQLPMAQGVLFTTPSPSAGPELLALLEAALGSGTPSPAPCPPLPQAAGTPMSSVLAAVDSNGSVLLLTSSLNSSFGSRHLSPSTGVLLSNLVAGPAANAWACPLILHGSPDDTEADVLGLVASGIPVAARTMASTLLRHLAVLRSQQEPTESPSICGQGTLLQVAVHAEHAHVSSVPHGCCPFQGF
ncbi:glutathione hydrolase 6 [Tamandua tetradactyla]|uniref:glutathione hydrolase 6 n=1 Tax=Tamandua tetradactyla TaxID=48850 RepID=UPI004053B19E